MVANGSEWIGNGWEWMGMDGNGLGMDWEWIGNGWEWMGMDGNGSECPNSFFRLAFRAQQCSTTRMLFDSLSGSFLMHREHLPIILQGYQAFDTIAESETRRNLPKKIFETFSWSN
jgi:hypothetical protein